MDKTCQTCTKRGAADCPCKDKGIKWTTPCSEWEGDSQ